MVQSPAWSFPNLNRLKRRIEFQTKKENRLWNHRDKTRVQTPAKYVSSFEIIMLAVYGHHSWFCHIAKKQFLIKYGVFLQ